MAKKAKKAKAKKASKPARKMAKPAATTVTVPMHTVVQFVKTFSSRRAVTLNLRAAPRNRKHW